MADNCWTWLEMAGIGWHWVIITGNVWNGEDKNSWKFL